MPQQVSVFRFVSYGFDTNTGIATFEYAFDHDITFIETLKFPLRMQAPETWPPQDRVDPVRNPGAFDRTLFLLSLVAGISYYKAAVPERAVIESGPVTQAELDFLRTVYLNGLGEFAYVNQIDLTDRPIFEAEIIEERSVGDVDVDARPLVPVGGGKDSCVTIELLRDASPTLASVNMAKAIIDVIEAAELPGLHVERSLSPELFRLNGEGALNGHVPITAVVSLTMVALALVHGFDSVVMSNERSASVGNVAWQGQLVNHQWSKSFEAELALSNLIKTSIAPNIGFFSLLRPLSELAIAKKFAELERYHDVFTSCNRAFRIDESRRTDRWCCDCPKCRFVFLALAPFMNPVRLTGIFGRDLLRDTEQTEGFDELIGWNAHKPFECVGEVEESVAAFQLLTQSLQWRDHELVRRFENEIRPQTTIPADVIDRALRPARQHNVPPQFQGHLHASV